MNQVLLLVVISHWIFSSLFVIYWHHKRTELNLITILGAILLGPILIFLIREHDKENKRHRNILEDNNRRMDETHRNWSRLSDRINRGERMIPNWHRTIPSPPPMSRIERALSERDNAIRSAIERIEPPNRRNNNIKTFKFFRN